jgi:hypothetical protein
MLASALSPNGSELPNMPRHMRSRLSLLQLRSDVLSRRVRRNGAPVRFPAFGRIVGNTMVGAFEMLTSLVGWARQGSNPRPRDYESPALTN